MLRYFGRNDIILVAVLILGALATACVFYISGSRGDRVIVYVDGSPVGEYPLSEDAGVDINGYGGGSNRLVIKDGSAFVEEASCPDKLCIHQGRISKEGQELICLPNRVVVRISGKDGSEYDALTQ